MEYRGSFIMYIFTVLGFYAAQIAVIVLMLHRFKHIGDWSQGEIAFLYCLLVMSQGLVSTVFSGLLNFSEFVREGTFDRVLLRPLSALLQILAMRFEPAGIAHFLMGIAALIAANLLMDLQWSFQSAFFLLLVIVGGALILGAIRIIIAGVAFFTISNAGLQHLVVFSSREFLLYPISIYLKPVQFFLTYLFPLAFINFYPAHFFLNKNDNGLFNPIFVYLTFPVGVGLLLLSLIWWRFAVRHYSSTGN